MANGVTNKDLYEAIKESNDSLKVELRNYVRKEQFDPVQKIVYGLAGVILVSFAGAIIALVLRSPQ